jgi:hypothetical protein
MRLSSVRSPFLVVVLLLHTRPRAGAGDPITPRRGVDRYERFRGSPKQ